MHAFEFLQKFLDELMVNHSKYLAPLIRTWNPNVLDQVIELVGKGRTVKTLTMEDKLSVFNILTSDKNYSRYVRLMYTSHVSIKNMIFVLASRIGLSSWKERNATPDWIV